MVSDTKPVRKVEYLTDEKMKKRIEGEVDRLDLQKDGTMALKPEKKSKQNKELIK